MPLRGPGLVPVRPFFPVVTKILYHTPLPLSYRLRRPMPLRTWTTCNAERLPRPFPASAPHPPCYLSSPMARAYTLTFSDPDPCS